HGRGLFVCAYGRAQEKDMDTKNWRLQTRAVRGGQIRSSFDETSEALVLTSGYAYPSAEEAEKTFKGESTHYQYSRFGNPTVSMFQERLAALEGAEACLATSTGMSAIFACCLGVLNAGDHIVSSHSVFGATVQLFNAILARFGVTTSYVSASDPNAWLRASNANTKLFYVETPSNPLM